MGKKEPVDAEAVTVEDAVTENEPVAPEEAFEE